VDGGVQIVQAGDLVGRQVTADGDDEIAVTVGVGVADGERALQVGADENIAKAPPDAGQKNGEHGVEVIKSCGGARGNAAGYGSIGQGKHPFAGVRRRSAARGQGAQARDRSRPASS
jgi:hypothetical protein